MNLFPGQVPRASRLHSVKKLMPPVRFELTPDGLRVHRSALAKLRRRKSGTGRTRTVIGLVDDQVPHLSATVPCEMLAARIGFEPMNS